ncbi:MAG: DUF4384 domain-containing protein [Candidatus Obscuribacterales bacterium]|nr:DUF4384 domain-containing protein [Candidatus Obscuribacterales bacterium]
MRNSTRILGILGAFVLGYSFCPEACPADGGAKDLFYKQQTSSSLVINTGIQYWIELKRAGKVSNVSNKFAFKSGDNIRIHVKSNVDAFAYIVLKEGSSGEQSVLFPDTHFHDNNKLKAGQDYSLPQEGYMAFDQNPGTEKVLLLLSRTPIDSNKFLADKTKKHVLIAAAPNGAKDLIPGSVVLAYAKQDAPVLNQIPDKPTGESNNGSILASNSSANLATSIEDATTTLVQKDPNQVLSIDLALMHQP